LNFFITSSAIVELFKIAIYLSNSVLPLKAAKPFDGEKFLTKDEIPLKALKKSVFSAGKTDVVALYHFGSNKAKIVTEAVIIKMDQNKNHRYFTTTIKNSIKEFPVLSLFEITSFALDFSVSMKS